MATDATGSATSGTSSASSGILSSLGVGSGLDIATLVSQLVTAERAPVQNRLTSQASALATQISAMAQLKSALSTFQTAADKLKDGTALSALQATTSDPAVFTATAGTGAAQSSYDVEVTQLAKAQQLVSSATFTSGARVVGTGTLTIKLGGSSVDVTLDAAHNTLSGIRDAINSAAGNPGVQASLISGTAGTQLVLTSTKTGASNTIAVTASGGDGGLAALAYSSTDTSKYTQKQQALDASLTIAGIAYTGSSNTIGNAIDGVTLTLLGTTAADTPATLTVAGDPTTVQTNVSDFVSAYNALISVFNTLDAYNADAGTSGPLFGDGLLLSISGSVTKLTTDKVSGLTGNYNSLATLGITTGSDGTLSLDTAKYAKALANDPTALQSIFSSTNGVATRLDSQLTNILSGTGSISARNNNLIASQKDLTDQAAQLDARMEQIQTRYTAQFTALDSLLAQLNSTASYLDRVFATKSSSS